jgi:hypothetical protein
LVVNSKSLLGRSAGTAPEENTKEETTNCNHNIEDSHDILFASN